MFRSSNFLVFQPLQHAQQTIHTSSQILVWLWPQIFNCSDSSRSTRQLPQSLKLSDNNNKPLNVPNPSDYYLYLLHWGKKISLCLFLYWVCAFVHGLEPAISYSVTLSIFGNSWPPTPHPTHTNTQSRSNQNYNKKHTTKRLRDLWSTYVPHILSKKWKCWRTMTRLQYIYIYICQS